MRSVLAIPGMRGRYAREIECQQCGVLFVGCGQRKGYCGEDECQGAARKSAEANRHRALRKMQERYRDQRGWTRSCQWCSKTFTFEIGWRNGNHCCGTCRNASHREGRRAAKARRRALLKGAQVETVVPAVVFKRDGYRCQRCGVRVLLRIHGRGRPTKSQQRRMATMDHIVALSLGGEHSYANCQTYCHQCNAEKGASLEGQQRLF